MSDVTTTADEPEVEASEAERETPFWQRLVAGSSTWIGLILVALILVFSVLEPDSFVDSANARNIATDAAVLLVLATGMTFVIITAGIDLSVGAILVFSGVVSARAMNGVGGDNWGVIIVGLVVALAAGAGWGVVNGFLVAKAKIPPFVVTLGTLGAALGASLVITGGVDEREVPFKLITTIGTGRAFDQIPWLVVIAFAVAIVFGVILATTRFGR
jgi:ribose transport system permease protein